MYKESYENCYNYNVIKWKCLGLAMNLDHAYTNFTIIFSRNLATTTPSSCNLYVFNIPASILCILAEAFLTNNYAIGATVSSLLQHPLPIFTANFTSWSALAPVCSYHSRCLFLRPLYQPRDYVS